MKKLAYILAFASFASMLLAGPGSKLRQKLESINKKITTAFLKMDANGVESATRPNVTKDFKYVVGDKVLTYDEMLAQMKSQFRFFKKVTVAKAKILSLSEHGNSATGTESDRLEAILGGSDNVPHKLVVENQSTETFRKEGGDWKMSLMKVTSSKATVDGRPLGQGPAKVRR